MGVVSPMRDRTFAAMTVGLAFWCQACVVSRPLPADVSVPQGERVSARSPIPFNLNDPDAGPSEAPLCRATAVEGRVRQVTGDTLILVRVSGIVTPPDADGVLRRCQTPEKVRFVRTSNSEMTVRQTDKGRTTLLLLGIAAALVGFAALGASQIEYSY
jgi:hypothetical protein